MRVNGILAAPKSAPKGNTVKQPESETIQIGNDSFIIKKDQVVIKTGEGVFCGPDIKITYEINNRGDYKKDKKYSWQGNAGCGGGDWLSGYFGRIHVRESDDQPGRINDIESEAINLVRKWQDRVNNPESAKSFYLGAADKANIEKVLKALWRVADH